MAERTKCVCALDLSTESIINFFPYCLLSWSTSTLPSSSLMMKLAKWKKINWNEWCQWPEKNKKNKKRTSNSKSLSNEAQNFFFVEETGKPKKKCGLCIPATPCRLNLPTLFHLKSVTLTHHQHSSWSTALGKPLCRFCACVYVYSRNGTFVDSSVPFTARSQA